MLTGIEPLDRRTFVQKTSIVAVASLLSATRARAQTPLTFIIPYAAGADTLVRQYVHVLGKTLGMSTVAENVPGASTALGMARLARASADGMTIGMISDSIAILRATGARMTIDASRQLQPLARLTKSNFILVASAASGLRTLEQVLAKGRSSADALSYASPGAGSPHHLAMASLCHRNGIKPVHIPFSGAGPALNEVAAGRADVAFVALTLVRPLLDARRIVVIASGSESRLPALPDTPTLIESGQGGFLAQGWIGLAAPSGVTPTTLAQLEAAAITAASDAGLRKEWEAAGFEAAPLGRDPFTRFIESEVSRYKTLIHTTGAVV